MISDGSHIENLDDRLRKDGEAIMRDPPRRLRVRTIDALRREATPAPGSIGGRTGGASRLAGRIAVAAALVVSLCLFARTTGPEKQPVRTGTMDRLWSTTMAGLFDSGITRRHRAELQRLEVGLVADARRFAEAGESMVQRTLSRLPRPLRDGSVEAGDQD